MVVSQKDTALCAQREPGGTFIAIWPKGSRHRWLVPVMRGFVSLGRRAHRRSESVCLLRARQSHPRKQQTSTSEQSGGSQPAPPPPTEAQVTTGEEAREGFPNAGAGTSRRPQGGLLGNPGKGGVSRAGDATSERVPSQRRAGELAAIFLKNVFFCLKTYFLALKSPLG